MAELEFKPKQSVKALLWNTIYIPRLRTDITKNQHDHRTWSDKYTPMIVPALERGRQTRKQETGVKFISCFFTLQTQLLSFIGTKGQERISEKNLLFPFLNTDQSSIS